MEENQIPSKSLQMAVEDPVMALRLVRLGVGALLALEAQGRVKEEPPPPKPARAAAPRALRAPRKRRRRKTKRRARRR